MITALMDPLEEDTPTLEAKPFSLSSTSDAATATSRRLPPVESDRTSSSEDGEDGGGTSPWDESDGEEERPCEGQGGDDTTKDGSRRRESDAAPSDMSNSYHEIFDAQMPPERAKASLQWEEAEEENDIFPSSMEKMSLGLPGDDGRQTTTDYLTSKLVNDSVKWQQQRNDSSSPPPPSPTRQQLSSLDPSLLLDLESDAHHLATSVDNLVESLSGVLQSISALTVEAIETYRDGVCKTCDEVDANIKAMYQLMAKVEELNKAMGPAYKMGEQLKDVKRLLDKLEQATGPSRK